MESLVDSGKLTFFGHQRNVTAPPFDLRSVNSSDWGRVKELKDQAEADVLVIDTVSRVAGIADKDTLAWRGFMTAQTQFARDNQCSILSIDHISRMREDGDASVSLAGAQSKGSDAPAIIKLTDNKADTALDRIWRIDTSSWYGDQSAPIYYRRPSFTDTSGQIEAGAGCERTEAPKEPRLLTQQAQCEEWLNGFMKSHDYEVARGGIFEAGALKGFTERAIARAGKAIGVASEKTFQGTATWYHPNRPRHSRLADESESAGIRPLS